MPQVYAPEPSAVNSLPCAPTRRPAPWSGPVTRALACPLAVPRGAVPSRPTAITLAKFTPASWPCVPPVAVGRDGRPPSPVGPPHPPGSRPTAITPAKFTPAPWRVRTARAGWRRDAWLPGLPAFVLLCVKNTRAPVACPIARGGSPPRRPVQNECFLSWFPAVFILSNVFPLCPIWFLC